MHELLIFLTKPAVAVDEQFLVHHVILLDLYFDDPRFMPYISIHKLLETSSLKLTNLTIKSRVCQKGKLRLH